MGEQGNLSDAMADYLSSRMDGDALDHTNGKQLLLHACKPWHSYNGDTYS